MNVQKIFSTLLIVFILGFFLFNLTYNKKDTQKILTHTVQNSSLGLYKIDRGNLTFTDNSITASGIIFKDIYSLNDSGYYSVLSKNAYKTTKKGNTTRIDIGEGLYFFDILDMSQKYFIENEAFRITVNSPGKFYIDSTQKTAVKVFSVDGVLEVILLSSGKEMTKASLYPHMYFQFIPSRSRFMKNADLSRLETVSNFAYVSGINFLDIEGSLKNIYSVLYSGKVSKNVEGFFGEVFAQFSNKINQNKTTKDLILDHQLNLIQGIPFIEQYYFVFINKEKKTVYLKNKILSKFNSILMGDNTVTKEEVISDMDVIKGLSLKDYNELKSILSYYYKGTLIYGSGDEVEKIFLFSDLIAHTNGTPEISKEIKSTFYLNNIYKQLHNGGIKKEELHSKILAYINYVFGENQIKYDEKNFSVNINQNSKFSLGYIAFFLKNILIFDMVISNDKNLQDFNKLFSVYYSINKTLALSKKGEIYETLIVEYESVLQKILLQMKRDFFEPEREKNGLLVKSGVKISVGALKDFNDKINLLFAFYQQNKSNLKDKNLILNQVYERYRGVYDEYYLAASSYQEYSVKYDQSKKDLINTQTINQLIDTSLVLDEGYVYKYFSQFRGVDTSNLGVVLENKQYYKITNLKVGPNVLSFELYPYEYHRMLNVTMNGKYSNAVYELDITKQNYEKLIENFKGKDGEVPPKFEDYFLRTFGNTQEVGEIKNNTDTPSNNENTIEIIDDRTLVVFKRDTLLGKNGEFSILSGYMNISFNDIDVKLKDNRYDIFVKKGEILYASGENGTKALLNSVYVFTNKDHYFKNPKIRFESIGENAQGMFGGAELEIQKNIQILDFKSETKKIFDTLLKNYGVYLQINSILGIQKVDLIYSPTNQVILGFTNKGRKYSCILDEKAEKITVNNSVMTLGEFSTYITNLK